MWMDLEGVRLSETGQRLIPYDGVHMWNLKSEINSWTQRADSSLPEAGAGGGGTW